MIDKKKVWYRFIFIKSGTRNSIIERPVKIQLTTLTTNLWPFFFLLLFLFFCFIYFFLFFYFNLTLLQYVFSPTPTPTLFGCLFTSEQKNFIHWSFVMVPDQRFVIKRKNSSDEFLSGSLFLRLWISCNVLQENCLEGRKTHFPPTPGVREDACDAGGEFQKKRNRIFLSLSLYMCFSLHLCVFVCAILYTCVCVCWYLRVDVRVGVFLYMTASLYVFVCFFICACVRVCISVRLWRCDCVSDSVFLHASI